MNESFLEEFAFALESCVTLLAAKCLFQQLFQIATKEKNQVKQTEWDPISLDSSAVPGRSEEIRTISLFSSMLVVPTCRMA